MPSRSSAIAIALGVAIVVGALPEKAWADDDDYFVRRGFRRKGFTIGFAGTGGRFFSAGCCDIGGKSAAGGASLRIGTAATARLTWILEADSGFVLVRDDATDELERNEHGALTLGAQYALVPTVWVKSGLGFSSYRIRVGGDQTAEVDLERSGFAWASSLGWEWLQVSDAWFFFLDRQSFAISLEMGVVAALYPGGTPVIGADDQATGVIVQLHSGLGFQWY
jgi:hypothetical protein